MKIKFPTDKNCGSCFWFHPRAMDFPMKSGQWGYCRRSLIIIQHSQTGEPMIVRADEMTNENWVCEGYNIK